LVLDNPIVFKFYTSKKMLHLRINASFFELNGWVADKRIYSGDFNPAYASAWSSKSKGEVMIQFEGDSHRTKCSLKLLLQHGLTLIDGDNSDDNSDDSEPPSTPDNAPQPKPIDPNATQQCGDEDSSSDGEGAQTGPAQVGMPCMHAPPPPYSHVPITCMTSMHLLTRVLSLCRSTSARSERWSEPSSCRCSGIP
jgi:hypothetical protein